MRIILCATLLLAITALSPASAQVTDVIRGRVTGPDSLPVQGVNVRATSYLGGVVKTTTTDKSGRFTIVFINGEGDYWMDFVKLGLAPRRFEVKKIGDEEVMIADTRMATTIVALDAVNVEAQRARALPNRNAAGVDVGGGERPLTNKDVPTDRAGNLAAMAAMVAGIQVVPGLDGAADVYSMLGLSGDQNNTTFNGLGSAVSALPPDILATTSILPYSFDPSRGGFSGAQINIATIPGSNFSRRGMSSAGILPALEWADPTASALGQKYTNMRFGGNAAGPIALDRLFYNTAYNVGRRFSDAQTLLNTSAVGLAAAGVAADSVSRLRSILLDQHIPVSAGGAPGILAQDVGQLSANVDIMPSSSGAGHSFTVGALGNFQRTQPVSRGGLLLATLAHAGETSFWGANAAITHTNYFWFGILSKTTLGWSASGTSSEPYERLPEGSVRVNSLLPDGSASVKSLFFGGNAQLASTTLQGAQLSNSLSWYTGNNKHTLKLTSSIAHDAFTNDAAQSLLGSFAFNSLADLDSGRASSFTRTLSKNTQSGRQLVGAASLGDYWRPTPNVQVQYGVRVDANRFLSAPATNPDVATAFGIPNDRVPNRAYLSPRVGLQWYYGDSPQIAYAPGAARPPRAVVHAGAGVFQNIASAQLIGPAAIATGLPSSTQSLSCVGSAVPVPNWEAFLTDPASIPTRCADGSVGSVFSSRSPSVMMFAPGFREPKSLRAAADWSGPILDNRFVLGVQTIVSSGLNQVGQVDINFRPESRFALANESGRPVFANIAAIVPSTGAIASSDTRVSPSFQAVRLERSDLRLDSKQLSINLKPVTASPRLRWDATYTLLDAREKYNGFSSTSGNPFDVQWGEHLQPGRHTFDLFWRDFPVFDVAYVTVGARLMSGQRYTPMIAGDVNGDGFANDRAFIFDPAGSDPQTATAMRSLLENGTRSARDCLARQLNALASRGSCSSPWTATTALSIKFNPQKIGLPKRATVGLQLQNPLAVADMLLHDSNALRGWGQSIPPDQNLLYVRGFDPTARRFKYEVNQRFGSTRPQQSSTRALPYLSLTVQFDIGVPRERQLLTRALDMGRAREGNKQGAESMKVFGTSAIPNPMTMILQQADTLKLTRVQADSLASLSRKFAVFTDSIWTPASRYFAGLPGEYNHGDAYAQYVVAREKTVDFLLTLVPHAKRVLTASQRRRLPLQLANFLDERVLKFLRSSTSGDVSPVISR